MPSSVRPPRSEYPRPQLVRPEWLCLNGPWDFQVDTGDNGQALGWPEKPKFGERIAVPFCPESRLSGIGRRDFMPHLWYARRFTLPRTWAGRRVLLHFGAVDYEASVWVNGKPVGFHRGGYTPFALEITDAIKSGANLLVVKVLDETPSGLQPSGKQSTAYHSSGCHYTRVSGIWQSVWLEPVGPSCIGSLRMIGDLEGGRVNVHAHIDRPQAGMTLLAEARIGKQVVARAEVEAVSGLAAACLNLEQVRPWDVRDPFLYDLELLLHDREGNVVDRAGSYFGLRNIRLEGPAILLNGRKVFQRLVLDQGYYPAGLYTAPRDEDLKRDIVLAQQLGFTGARLHQKLFEPRFLYWADRLGYLLWGEYASWGLDRTEGEALRRFMAEWTEAVQRDFNHPSIIGWCPFNEARNWADAQMLRDVYRLTKALDPTRPVIDSSGWDHFETDVYDSHSYEQDPGKFAALFADFAQGGKPYSNCESTVPYAGQPYFVSEYGGIWWNPGQKRGEKAWGYGERPRSLEEFIDRYRKLTTELLKHPRMCAFCYTQLYDIEQEVNGLLTYDRRMKVDPKIIYQINQQPAAIE